MNNKKPKRRTSQNTPRGSSASKVKKAAVKLSKSQVEELEDEDKENAKEVAQPPSLLEVLPCEKICLFPGIRKRRIGEDIVSFRNCLPLLGSCDVLIFCELNRTLPETRDHVAQQVDTLRDWIRIQVHPHDCLNLPVPERDQLFPRCAESPPDWLPGDAKPPIDRFWGLWSELELFHPEYRKKLDVLHLGIGGQAVWLYLIYPHRLEVNRIIIDPREDHPGFMAGG